MTLIIDIIKKIKNGIKPIIFLVILGTSIFLILYFFLFK